MKSDKINNYQNFKIFFTFFLIWVSIQFGSIVEDYIGYLLVISIGILHGANDLLIISIKEKVKILDKKNLFIYLSIVFFCFLLFFMQPFFSICIFILISSYHFGEEHFNNPIKLNIWIKNLYYIIYGLLLFSILFISSLEDVKAIMIELTGYFFSETQIKVVLVSSGILFLTFSLLLVIKKKITVLNLVQECFYLFLLAVVFNTSSLILGFAIYFILWHSIPSILHQIAFISGDFTKQNMVFYLKKASIFWLLSIFGLLILHQMFNDTKLFNSLVFIILFAVTAPHIWVMYKMKN